MPGQSGNSAGRPKGSRNKLGEQFLTDLYADWVENGVAAIKKVRETRPEIYLKVSPPSFRSNSRSRATRSMELRTINSLLSSLPPETPSALPTRAQQKQARRAEKAGHMVACRAAAGFSPGGPARSAAPCRPATLPTAKRAACMTDQAIQNDRRPSASYDRHLASDGWRELHRVFVEGVELMRGHMQTA
jgi:hypothetical protein